MNNRLLFETLLHEKTAASELKQTARDFINGQIALGRSAWACHPLGFFVIKQAVAEDMELRLHVWPKGWAVPHSQTEAELHDHVFSLSSFVVLGSVSNDTFDMTVDPNGEFRTIEVTYSGSSSGGSVLSKTLYRLDLKATEVHQAGEIYHLPAGIVHRGGALSAPAITLLATHKDPNFHAPRIVVQKDTSPPPIFSRNVPDEYQWSQIVAVVDVAVGNSVRSLL